MKKRFVCAAALAAAILFVFAIALRGPNEKQELFKREVEAHASAAQTPMANGLGATFATGTPGMGGGVGRNASAGASASAAAPEESAKLTLASMSDSQVDRYLIKNAVVLIEAKDVVQAADLAKGFTRSVNGYVSSSHEAVDSLGLKNETLEVRVPANQFDAAMQSVSGLGRVLDSQITSEDVTEQYVDTDAQLRNLKKTEERLLEHLSRTGKLSDTLLIETELTRVRESLNELEGKLRFMSHRITYSTINLTFKEPAHVEPITPAESFSLGQVATQAMRSVSGFLQQVMSVGVWVLIWSVIWAPLAAGGIYVYLRFLRTVGRRLG